MTSYDGKCLSFVPGKEVVNREPPVSKYVVEKLYKVHRSRVLSCEAVIDSHMVVPKFLVDQTWKKLAAKHKENIMMQHNEQIFQRIAKVENQESAYTKETREHVKIVKHKAKYMKHLKEVGRLRKLLKIQKENEYMAKRLERTKPEYSLKGCKEWYKYHESFKNGRRNDPTAGHIMKGLKGLLPGSLPPIEGADSSKSRLMSFECSVDYDNSLVRASQSANGSKLSSIRGLPSFSNSSRILGTSSSTLLEYDSIADLTTAKSVEDRLRNRNKRKSVLTKASLDSSKQSTSDADDDSDKDSTNDLDMTEEEHGRNLNTINAKTSLTLSQSDDGSSTEVQGETQADPLLDCPHDWMVIFAKIQNIPHDSKTCVIQICVSKHYDENLYIRVLSNANLSRCYCERSVPIDSAYDIIAKGAESSANISRVAGFEDMHSLRALLIDMFKEADVDGSGYLTFDEFQELMAKVDLGISSQELRFVISEADENENGVVDYHEFIPLAVDMIQSFRARNRAKKVNREEDSFLDEEIMRSLSKEELKSLTRDSLERIKELDTKGYGVIKSNELRRCLSSTPPLGLTETEISLICQMLPRDPFGRCVYSKFEDVLMQVRFLTMKNAVVESQGSDLQKYLLDICKEEEMKLKRLQGDNDAVATGMLAFRSLIAILCNAPRLSLTRLQVMVIMAEAIVVDGMINYYQFIPVVAKTIEYMFEPKSLRLRAELIETTDLSPEALLQGMSSDMFEQRLLTLFKSYDIDHNGVLDEEEFMACLQSLDLQLTKGEMVALFATADINNVGVLKFEDFVQFFTHNLIHLEREKHIRLLQKSIHSRSQEMDGKSDLEKYIDHLTTIFRLADTENTGKLQYTEFVEVLKSLEVNISEFELNIVLSELDSDGDGLIEYSKFVPVSAGLIRAFKANEMAAESRLEKEKWAESKANKLVVASQSEIHHIVRYLRERIKLIEETVEDPMARLTTVQDILRNPHSGLSRPEANLLMGKLFSYPKKAGGNTPMKNGKGAPTLRQDLGARELFDLIVEARKQSIMRNLLEDLNSDSLRSSILKMLESEAQRLKNEDKLDPESSFIPVKNCYKVLERATNLRLVRAEIIAIISWADCYDPTGLMLDVKRFADHVAGVLSKIKEAEFVDTTAAVLDKGMIDEKKIMCGLKKEEMDEYFMQEFSIRDNGSGLIPFDIFLEIVRRLPKVRLGEKEAIAVASSFNQVADGMIDWKEFIPWAHNTIQALLKDRVLHRRVTLFAASDESGANSNEANKQAFEEALSDLRDLAENFIEFIKLRSQGDNVYIVLPDDAMMKSHGVSSNKIELNRMGIMLPLISQAFIKKESKSSHAHHVIKTKMVTATKIPILLRVLACDNESSIEKDVVVCVSSIHDPQTKEVTVPVKLPSIAMLDPDVAGEFSKNLVDRLYFEYYSDKEKMDFSKLSLRMISDPEKH